MKNVKVAGAVIGVLLIVVIILQNTDSVETKFLFLTVTMPRAALLVVTFLIGAACGMVGATLYRRRAPRTGGAAGADSEPLA